MRHLLFATLCFCSLGVFAGQRYYVAPESRGDGSGLSWDDASDRLYSIIEDAQPGDIIYVAQGRYYGGFTVKNGVTVLGGYTVGDDAPESRVLPEENTDRGSILDGCNKYRVITQTSALDTPAIFDGFVIENGSATSGAGALIMDGCTLKNCLVRNCASGLPAVGEYIDKAKGVVIGADKTSNTIDVVSTTFASKLCQYERAQYFAGNANTPGNARWRIPTAEDMRAMLSYPANEIIGSALKTNGCKDFGTSKIWTATETESAGLEGRYVADLRTGELMPMNRWQYCRVLPAGSYTESVGRTVGGGIKASGKAAISNCTVTGNKATLGSGIHARNGVYIYNTTVHGNVSDNQLNTDDSVIIEEETGINGINADSSISPIAGNIVAAGSDIEITSPGFTSYAIHSVSGQLIDAGSIGENGAVTAPQARGMYMLSLSDSNRTSTVKIIVK